MLYTVECDYADPASEAAWNEFYSQEKLPALIAVPGFYRSQRFRALAGSGPTYLALHHIAGAEVLASAAYRAGGGGNFARWQAHITRWRRNVYGWMHSGAAVPPGLSPGPDQLLLVSEVPPARLAAFATLPGLPDLPPAENWQALVAEALDQAPPQRWLTVVPRGGFDTALAALPAPLDVYEPLGPALVASPAPRS